MGSIFVSHNQLAKGQSQDLIQLYCNQEEILEQKLEAPSQIKEDTSDDSWETYEANQMKVANDINAVLSQIDTLPDFPIDDYMAEGWFKLEGVDIVEPVKRELDKINYEDEIRKVMFLQEVSYQQIQKVNEEWEHLTEDYYKSLSCLSNTIFSQNLDIEEKKTYIENFNKRIAQNKEEIEKRKQTITFKQQEIEKQQDQLKSIVDSNSFYWVILGRAKHDQGVKPSKAEELLRQVASEHAVRYTIAPLVKTKVIISQNIVLSQTVTRKLDGKAESDDNRPPRQEFDGPNQKFVQALTSVYKVTPYFGEEDSPFLQKSFSNFASTTSEDDQDGVEIKTTILRSSEDLLELGWPPEEVKAVQNLINDSEKNNRKTEQKIFQAKRNLENVQLRIKSSIKTLETEIETFHSINESFLKQIEETNAELVEIQQKLDEWAREQQVLEQQFREHLANRKRVVLELASGPYNFDEPAVYLQKLIADTKDSVVRKTRLRHISILDTVANHEYKPKTDQVIFEPSFERFKIVSKAILTKDAKNIIQLALAFEMKVSLDPEKIKKIKASDRNFPNFLFRDGIVIDTQEKLEWMLFPQPLNWFRTNNVDVDLNRLLRDLGTSLDQNPANSDLKVTYDLLVDLHRRLNSHQRNILLDFLGLTQIENLKHTDFTDSNIALLKLFIKDLQTHLAGFNENSNNSWRLPTNQELKSFIERYHAFEENPALLSKEIWIDGDLGRFWIADLSGGGKQHSTLVVKRELLAAVGCCFPQVASEAGVSSVFFVRKNLD